ncbi:MAG TPA: hypothetical protein DD716_06225 [Thiomicrospira sp.]|nr:hypothetical protein [Thiomicrospira sp.]
MLRALVLIIVGLFCSISLADSNSNNWLAKKQNFFYSLMQMNNDNGTIISFFPKNKLDWLPTSKHLLEYVVKNGKVSGELWFFSKEDKSKKYYPLVVVNGNEIELPYLAPFMVPPNKLVKFDFDIVLEKDFSQIVFIMLNENSLYDSSVRVGFLTSLDEQSSFSSVSKAFTVCSSNCNSLNNKRFSKVTVPNYLSRLVDYKRNQINEIDTYIKREEAIN